MLHKFLVCATVSITCSGCGSLGMSNLRLKTPGVDVRTMDGAPSNREHSAAGIELKRYTCQAYADESATFIGWQQGLGVAAVVVGVVLATLGAALPDEDSGAFVERHRKTLLLAGAVASAPLAINFLGNASAASSSAAQASVALASKDDDEMWAGCEFARASYFDGRGAAIAATRAVMQTGKQSLPPAEAEAAEAARAAKAATAAEAAKVAEAGRAAEAATAATELKK
jgi:hypothetical protein